MTFNTFLRHVREGFKNIFRNGWMSVASVTSIIVSLLILGVFIMLVLNVNSLADQADSQVEVNVFLELNVEQNMRETLQKEIAAMPEISKTTFVTKAQGLEELRKDLGDSGKELLEGFDKDSNPLPDKIVVEVIEPTTVPFVAEKIEKLNTLHPEKPILKVRYGKGTVETLFTITKLIRNVGFIFVAGLAIMSMFLISNTIRVTILARRREIGIMKLVGATNFFIRWPFFIEGALIGLIGSLITVGILFTGYQRLLTAVQGDIALNMLKLMPLEGIWIQLSALLIILGMLVGIVGSTLSMRKFLKV
ncbi:permease-like cell division protein FtsX [Paenibacillus sp. SEL3]|jgi:cell division transport system permease protein|uniref:Cell division protein FtsX n=2 Tax=Paenibacillus TaxID=44249 RepID=A0A0M1QAW4_PAEPO|nr:MULTISPECIES: permease-like cell division protein FtsX [Paenibacillus]KAF6634886.1 ABC transporter permease [Paenibacillus sp. EKM208P]MCF2716112.1 permease-like cell division protein FtsX [Paenibacillus sp. UKAQ_18]ADM72127.1 cell division protein FtsX [Paenibacillus polymyxa E681]AIW41913.1 cell division protein FtsX [Paenibacillus polymyxa CR1]ALA44161.1 cell division protein FtsX [Paenibacillus peoriae]